MPGLKGVRQHRRHQNNLATHLRSPHILRVYTSYRRKQTSTPQSVLSNRPHRYLHWCQLGICTGEWVCACVRTCNTRAIKHQCQHTTHAGRDFFFFLIKREGCIWHTAAAIRLYCILVCRWYEKAVDGRSKQPFAIGKVEIIKVTGKKLHQIPKWVTLAWSPKVARASNPVGSRLYAWIVRWGRARCGGRKKGQQQ